MSSVAVLPESGAGAASPPVAAPRPPITLRQLLGFAATLLGAFATSLGGQLVTAGLGDIQGGLGVSADEASWISSVYPMAQILMVPLAAPLALALGVRRFLMILTGLFLFSCLLAASARTLEGEVVLRLLQGIAAGGYGAAAFSLTFRTFGGRDLRPGLMSLAFATTFPTAIGVLSSAWLIDGFGWQAIYVAEAALAIVVLAGVHQFLDQECFHPAKLDGLDWGGFGLLAPGLGLLFLVLSQGDRRFWTEAAWLGSCLAAALVLLFAFVVVETHRKNPLVNLRMAFHPNFGVACAVNFVFRLVLLSPTVVVPRFLSEVQGYRNTELDAVFWLPALCQIVMYPLVTVLLSRVDPRALIGLGFALLGGAMAIDMGHTALSSAEQFLVSQLLAGLAPPLVIVPVLLLGVRGVQPQDGPSAGVLWNVSLILGSTGGAGVLAYFIRMRTYHHSNHLNDFLSQGWQPAADRLDALAAALGSRLSDDAAALVAATASLASQVHAQALVLALDDVFIVLGALSVLGMTLALLFPRWERPRSPS